MPSLAARLRAPVEEGTTALAKPWGPFDDYRVAHRALRRALGPVLEPFGLVVTDYAALRLASLGPTRPSRLSLHLGISPAATTELMDRLERRELVRRERDPEDRRATVLSLSKTGEKLYRAAALAHQQYLEQLAREMSPEGLAALQKGSRELKRVLERRERTRGPGSSEG
ncbi:MAG: winged helix-turn-helix transcriptional regulator [Euryarchaeota archaeon]|nr:winged helix-turn-helix transcriptional regulator [Euryarchaeota archaeon]MDE1837034.1 winged helix-turn-helix transcriptional regulator [Euryarchaeota archaeon]MDE1879884.1 winged helix-turn-helix transcriptional regulator [Euryarchaeota archaeon]